MTNFDNCETTLSHDPTSSSSLAGPTALAAVTPLTSTSTCIMCHNFVIVVALTEVHDEQCLSECAHVNANKV